MNLKQSQKTTVPAEKHLDKKWFLVDVKGKTLGPTAVKIANLLRGKEKTFFTPEQDCGDYVVAINAKHIRLSKNKMDTKLYQWHTRYPSGFRQRTAKEMMEKKPDKILFAAVWGMLPRTKSRKHIIKKLRIFPEETHDHGAQKLQPLEI
ncbi:MAG: 50S ribosomal protein L13 [Patescibacteria group bacterium]